MDRVLARAGSWSAAGDSGHDYRTIIVHRADRHSEPSAKRAGAHASTCAVTGTGVRLGVRPSVPLLYPSQICP